MIVFVDHPQIIPLISDKIGGTQPIQVLNFTSLYSGYPSLSALTTNMYNMNQSGLPSNIYVDTVQFDIQYANAIFRDDKMFEAFMSIMIPVHEGINSILLVHRDTYRDSLMESLIKLIQQRYGYNSWIVEDIDDIDCIHESTFTPYGIMALDADIKRYDELYNCGRVSSRIINPINVE